MEPNRIGFILGRAKARTGPGSPRLAKTGYAGGGLHGPGPVLVVKRKRREADRVLDCRSRVGVNLVLVSRGTFANPVQGFLGTTAEPPWPPSRVIDAMSGSTILLLSGLRSPAQLRNFASTRLRRANGALWTKSVLRGLRRRSLAQTSPGPLKREPSGLGKIYACMGRCVVCAFPGDIA